MYFDFINNIINKILYIFLRVGTSEKKDIITYCGNKFKIKKEEKKNNL